MKYIRKPIDYTILDGVGAGGVKVCSFRLLLYTCILYDACEMNLLTKTSDEGHDTHDILTVYPPLHCTLVYIEESDDKMLEEKHCFQARFCQIVKHVQPDGWLCK